MNKDSNSSELKQVQRAIFSALAIMSILGLGIVALTIFKNKKLNAHPSPLIARICLVEAVMCWNALLRFLNTEIPICYFKLYMLFNYTSG
jgi:hypothetical protein